MNTSNTPVWRRWGRRISFWVLIGAVIYLALRVLQGQPVEVVVTYHYGKAAHGLALARMVYRDAAGEELRRVRFGYERQRARATQRHTVGLPRGQYQVEIVLRYRGPAPQGLVGHRVEPSSVRLSRPLIVSGQGQVNVFVE